MYSYLIFLELFHDNKWNRKTPILFAETKDEAVEKRGSLMSIDKEIRGSVKKRRVTLQKIDTKESESVDI